jgi:hypothetical protein
MEKWSATHKPGNQLVPLNQLGISYEHFENTIRVPALTSDFRPPPYFFPPSNPSFSSAFGGFFPIQQRIN